MENFVHSFYTIRFSDCDPYRHLNNARYIDYFLNAREDHLRDHYGMDLADFLREGTGWVVARHDIQYLRPAACNEKVCILSGLLEAGPEHLLVEMIMMNEDRTQLKALLHTQFVPINLANGKKQPHRTEFLEFVSSKIVPNTPDPVPAARERASLLQQKLRSLQIA